MKHYSKADKFFTEEGKKRIEETIHDVESRTTERLLLWWSTAVTNILRLRQWAAYL